MRLTRIDIDGFGCLQDFRAELAPGMNVFYGMNEAGKSTLQQAIRALLYGFYDADRARPDETARHERFRPWEGGRYRGSLEYEMADGRRYEVRRDFSTADVPTQLIDVVTGQDVAVEFGRGRHGNIPFARRQLGMSRNVFQNCAFISQGEVFHVSDNGPKEIADAIAALADTAGRDVSATKAIERLKATLARVGSDRARTAELPKARESLRTARAELEAIDRARAALASRAAELDRLQERVERAGAEIARADYEYYAARARELTGRLESLRQVEETLTRAEETKRELAAYARFPVEQRDEVLALETRLERAEEEAEESRRRLQDAEARLSPDDRIEFETLRANVGSLTAEQIAALEAVAYAKVRALPVRIAIAVGRWITRAAKAVWRFITRRPRAEEEKEPALPVVSREEAVSLLEKHRRYLLLAPEVERLREVQGRLEAEEGDCNYARRRLASLLEAAGIEASENIEAGIEAFQEGARLRGRYESAVSDAENAARRIDLLLDGAPRDEIEAELRECEERADKMRNAAPVAANTGKSGNSRQAEEKRQRLREERRRIELEYERLREEIRVTMSQHRSRAEVEEEVEHWRRRVETLERSRSALTEAISAIEEAMQSVYRDFAPAVNTFLSDGVEHVTGGRYTRAHVDPETLAISLLVPETGQVVTDPPVSHGTRTLAYILMRIGLAQHMSAIGEPVPLVLDDPFVDVDAERLPRILEYLAGLSGRMQVLIFTKDEQVSGWLEALAAGEKHRLHRLVQSPAGVTPV